MSKTPLRVLFVGLKWPPETFLARLVRGLAGHGVSLTLAVPKAPGNIWRSLDNVDFLYTPGWTGSRPRRVARIGYRFGAAATRSPGRAMETYRQARTVETGATAAEQLYRWLPFAGRSWDIIYFPWNATAVRYLPLMDHGATVISCRGNQINIAPLNPERETLRRGLPITFARASAVHCVSEAILEEATHYGLDRAKATVIRPAVDPDVFRPQRGAKERSPLLRVVTTGSIIWRKGYEYALMALALLRRRGVPVHLDVIGTGDEIQRLLYTINDLEINELVTWRGPLPPDKVLRFLQQSDVFLLSSLSEGISNAVLEAMSCGLAIVTTDAGGMEEAVTDGVEGLVVPPRDAVAMADALAWLWQNPVQREAMGGAGRARVLRDFRLEDQIFAFENLFRSVA